MNRRDFLKNIGFGSAAIILPTTLLSSVFLIDNPVQEVVYNEGLWFQLKRGKQITYSRGGGITKEHLIQVREHFFQGNEPYENKRAIIKYVPTKKGYYVINEVTYTT